MDEEHHAMMLGPDGTVTDPVNPDLRYKIDLVMEGLRHPDVAEKALVSPLTPEELAKMDLAFEEFLMKVGEWIYTVAANGYWHPKRKKTAAREFIQEAKDDGFELVFVRDLNGGQ